MHNEKIKDSKCWTDREEDRQKAEQLKFAKAAGDKELENRLWTELCDTYRFRVTALPPNNR